MRKRSGQSSLEAKVDLTPMLDVVFILLIFFIVTSTFLEEKAIGLEPPPPNCVECQMDSPPGILVHVSSDNIIRISGELVDLSSVRSNIERRRAEAPEAAVIIQADVTASSGTILRLRDIIYDANIERVNIVRSASQT